jgi:hypothetical protein
VDCRGGAVVTGPEPPRHEAPPARSPALRAHLESIAARNRRLAEEADGDRRRDVWRSALACFFWLAVGLGCMMWSFHTTDEGYGRAAFFLGLGVGNGGIVFTLLALWRRGERRGDW